MERASSQSYGAKDKAIVDVAERPRPQREARDRNYAADPINQGLIEKARQRLATARANPVKLPLSEADRRAVNDGLKAWSAVAQEAPSGAVASGMVQRLTMAQTLGGIIHTIEKRLQHWLGKEDKPVAITLEQMAKDLRAMNDAVSRTTDLLDGATKDQFRETSERYLETLALRVDFQRMQERGVQELSRADIQRLAGVSADRLIERADAVRVKEERKQPTPRGWPIARSKSNAARRAGGTGSTVAAGTCFRARHCCWHAASGRAGGKGSRCGSRSNSGSRGIARPASTRRPCAD